MNTIIVYCLLVVPANTSLYRISSFDDFMFTAYRFLLSHLFYTLRIYKYKNIVLDLTSCFYDLECTHDKVFIQITRYMQINLVGRLSCDTWRSFDFTGNALQVSGAVVLLLAPLWCNVCLFAGNVFLSEYLQQSFRHVKWSLSAAVITLTVFQKT